MRRIKHDKTKSNQGTVENTIGSGRLFGKQPQPYQTSFIRRHVHTTLDAPGRLARRLRAELAKIGKAHNVGADETLFKVRMNGARGLGRF